MSKKGLNARQKLFAINLSNGMTQTQAYINAGYDVTPEQAKVNASKLITTNSNVQAYLNRLLEAKRQTAIKAYSDSIMSKQEIQARLTNIARANLVDFLDDSGEPKLDKNTPGNAAAREYYTRKKKDNSGNIITTRSIKLTDPISALQELNKMQGNYAPNRNINESISFEIKMVTRPPKRDTEQDFIEPE